MISTYKAILRGDRLEWLSNRTPNITGNQPLLVDVTITDAHADSEIDEKSGGLIADALSRLAELNGMSQLEDPALWERQIRRDRELPDRK